MSISPNSSIKLPSEGKSLKFIGFFAYSAYAGKSSLLVNISKISLGALLVSIVLSVMLASLESVSFHV